MIDVIRQGLVARSTSVLRNQAERGFGLGAARWDLPGGETAPLGFDDSFAARGDDDVVSGSLSGARQRQQGQQMTMGGVGRHENARLR